jgi:uncharacterized protein YndB with AHSA1/START domain
MANVIGFSSARTIHAPIARVWNVIADFGNEHIWVSGMKICRRDTAQVGVGTSRFCELNMPVMGRTEVKETLVEFDPGRSMAYELEGAAGPFVEAASRWTLQAIGFGMTRIKVEGKFRAKNWAARTLVWPLAKPMIVRLTQRTLGELEAYLASEAKAVSEAFSDSGPRHQDLPKG